MENANAVNPTPEAAPQAQPTEGPATQTPAAEASPAPAETSVVTTPEPTFDEATQKYLENQNIKGTPNEIVAELVKRNQQLRNQPKVEAVADVLKQDPPKQEAPAPASTRSLTNSDILATKMYVESRYPDVKVDADFYKEMIAKGWNPMDGSNINVDNVEEYARYKQELSDAAKIKAQANTPVSIPSPSNTIDDNSPIQSPQVMDKRAAENIVLWSAQQERFGKAPHPDLARAKQFLQDEARKGSF